VVDARPIHKPQLWDALEWRINKIRITIPSPASARAGEIL
jgi:hypothetical protein